MENKEMKLNAVELNDDALENVSGGAGSYETVTVSGATCGVCGGTINGTARFYPDSGTYRCPNCYITVRALE